MEISPSEHEHGQDRESPTLAAAADTTAGEFAKTLGVEPVMLPGGHESLPTDPDPLAARILDFAG